MPLPFLPNLVLTNVQKSASIFAPVSQFGFRKNYDPSHYNMRFKPSQGLDGNYVATNAPYHGPNGTESVSELPFPKPNSSWLAAPLEKNRKRSIQVQLHDQHDRQRLLGMENESW